jgi:hypothetical protein
MSLNFKISAFDWGEEIPWRNLEFDQIPPESLYARNEH